MIVCLFATSCNDGTYLEENDIDVSILSDGTFAEIVVGIEEIVHKESDGMYLSGVLIEYISEGVAKRNIVFEYRNLISENDTLAKTSMDITYSTDSNRAYHYRLIHGDAKMVGVQYPEAIIDLSNLNYTITDLYTIIDKMVKGIHYLKIINVSARLSNLGLRIIVEGNTNLKTDARDEIVISIHELKEMVG
jgi:hypothetical protein